MSKMCFIVADVVICIFANTQCQFRGPIELFQTLSSEFLVPFSHPALDSHNWCGQTKKLSGKESFMYIYIYCTLEPLLKDSLN